MSLQDVMASSIYHDDEHVRATFHAHYRFFRELAEKHSVDSHIHTDEMRRILERDGHWPRPYVPPPPTVPPHAFDRDQGPNSFKHSPRKTSLPPSPIKIWGIRDTHVDEGMSRHGPMWRPPAGYVHKPMTRGILHYSAMPTPPARPPPAPEPQPVAVPVTVTVVAAHGRPLTEAAVADGKGKGKVKGKGAEKGKGKGKGKVPLEQPDVASFQRWRPPSRHVHPTEILEQKLMSKSRPVGISHSATYAGKGKGKGPEKRQIGGVDMKGKGAKGKGKKGK
eukprot:TRINITY_DN8104_c0_g1_i1.p1 TRINITY_DN8104_c0_g1~~TRINITY_DN8104_c0_g1_i1.p1  ORF type:complete len:278 (+),score=20.19 TRINITY_DN8104_c0_g1_i1:113-946(+)